MKNKLKEKISLLKPFVLSGIFFLIVNTISAQDSKGKEFWICFPGNQQSLSTELYITSSVSSSVTIEVPGIAFSQVVAVPAGGVKTVTLPGEVQVQSKFVAEKKGIHITSSSEITVYGMNAVTASTDAFLAYPLDAIGKEYYVMAYSKDFSYALPSQATIVATEDATNVTILSSLTDGGFKKAVPRVVNLNKGEVYQLRSNVDGADYTGTKIISDKPVSVFGGAQCTNVSDGVRACDHLVEQIPALNTWGKKFLTVPLATRLKGDVFRFLAQKDSTSVSINGAVVTTLNAGQFFETLVNSNAYNSVTASQPILVGQYSRSSQADNVVSDPFFALITPEEQCVAEYIISAGTKNISKNYLNITAPAEAVQNIEIDGIKIDGLLWKSIPGTNSFGAQVPVSIGAHTVYGKVPFGLLVYGFGLYDSYGYAGGQSFVPQKSSSNISIFPKTDTKAITNQQCFTATVKDQQNLPVAGVKVDFVVIGPNGETGGSANTDTAGKAIFCYTGAYPGTDRVKASLAAESDEAAMTWSDTCSMKNTLNKLDPQCMGSANGMIDLTVNNAAAPVKYLWSNGTQTQDLSGLKAGTYSVHVTDKNGCQDSLSIALIDPPAIRTLNVITPNPTVTGQQRNTVFLGYGPQTVALSVRTYGGVPPYSYNWGIYGSNATANVSPKFTTAFPCEIKDSWGCTRQISITVNVVDVRCGTNNDKVLVCNKTVTNTYQTLCLDPSSVAGYLSQGAVLGSCDNILRPVANTSTILTQSATLFPNPANNFLDVKWELVNNSTEVILNVVDIKGIIQMSVRSSNVSQKKLDISHLRNGVYLLQVIGANNSTLTSRFIVTK
jgi:hypothetical protein